jgi:hypothetical protein
MYKKQQFLKTDENLSTGYVRATLKFNLTFIGTCFKESKGRNRLGSKPVLHPNPHKLQEISHEKEKQKTIEEVISSGCKNPACGL